MNSLEKLLQDYSDFIHDVSKISLTYVQELEIESSKELVLYHPLEYGHMLRPLLVYITANAIKETISKTANKKLATFAASVELMHNASLLHDDLLDEEEQRRGKPCLYRQYGFKNGLLAGNIFYIKAIGLANQNLGIVQTADLLNSAIAMCEGEILQAKYENEQIPEADYTQIIRCKTGSLTALACRQAAVIMEVDEQTTELFGKLGEELGVMYQLRDDRKDHDVDVGSGFEYLNSISSCGNRISVILSELSKTQKIEQFEEIIAYFKN